LLPVLCGISDNDHIRHGITDIYADFVRQVDPSGHIFDYLIQNRIVKVEIVEKWRGIAGPQDRCRAMINELLVRGNPTAFVVLREALEEDHDHIVQKIDEKTAGVCLLLQCQYRSIFQGLYTVWYCFDRDVFLLKQHPCSIKVLKTPFSLFLHTRSSG